MNQSRSARILRGILWLLATPCCLVVIGVLVVLLAAVLEYSRLPALDDLTDYRPALPLRVFTAQGTLIGEFGKERRVVVAFSDVPQSLRAAIVAAEDDRFYQHHGIDYPSIVRAALADLSSWEKRQGASTLTMQLARSVYLSPEKSFERKFAEALLAVKIERTLSKEQILERYVNQIYLGEGAYGFAAAADVYFGMPLNQLSVAQAALLAGLTKAPSRDNPVVNFAAAIARQRYVLGRMLALGVLAPDQFQQAIAEPIHLREARARYRVNAAYVAEDVRRIMVQQYGDAAYQIGLNVYTTLHDADQARAYQAVARGLVAYDMRHGYRGPERNLDLPRDPVQVKAVVMQALSGLPSLGGLVPAVVLSVHSGAASVMFADGSTGRFSIGPMGRATLGKGRAMPLAARLQIGSLVRLERLDNGTWRLAEIPQAQAALVSIDPATGAITALQGGFDFRLESYDHVTQARRQPGSSFKPFIYSAALEKGLMPATMVDDSPFVVPPSGPGQKAWAPVDYERNYLGPISIRYALAESRNVVAARVIEQIGVPYARQYVTRFGFPLSEIPPYPSMVLGVGSFTPLQMAVAYATFANGGYLIRPYLIDRMTDSSGNVLFQAHPLTAADGAPRVIDARNAFMMTSMLHDVVEYGTGAAAKQLGRGDLAGKTGTTDDFIDAWFDGYSSDRLTITWIGFDQPRSLGKGEVGARAALPIWMDFMKAALENSPERQLTAPDGVVTVRINPATGLQVPETDLSGRLDYFFEENVPPMEPTAIENGEAQPEGAPAEQ
ncbi:penicillin-binding protein 1A [Cupriavidus sp. CuC1]|uniref:penicillin-binding protein 1A n=1 Tax=Cupriavidus sp. CuC1 TaxID=3373131 RepID=UPI0037D4BE5A